PDEGRSALLKFLDLPEFGQKIDSDSCRGVDSRLRAIHWETLRSLRPRTPVRVGAHFDVWCHDISKLAPPIEAEPMDQLAWVVRTIESAIASPRPVPPDDDDVR